MVFGNLPINIKTINMYENSSDKQKENNFIKVFLSNNYYDGNFN